MLIPLRDEMSILLGTNTLPALFASSLLVSMLSQPITSYIVTSSAGSVPAGLQRFFTIVACVLLVFAGLISAANMPTQPNSTSVDAAGLSGLGRTQTTQHVMYADMAAAQSGGKARHVRHWLLDSGAMRLASKLMEHEDHDEAISERLDAGITDADVQDIADEYIDLDHDPRQLQDAATQELQVEHEPLDHGGSSSNSTAGSSSFEVGSGDASLGFGKRALYVAFYLWMSTQNLVSASVLWARCADVFANRGAERIFGVIAAAATAGQLLGSTTTALLCRSCGKSLPTGATPATF